MESMERRGDGGREANETASSLPLLPVTTAGPIKDPSSIPPLAGVLTLIMTRLWPIGAPEMKELLKVEVRVSATNPFQYFLHDFIGRGACVGEPPIQPLVPGHLQRCGSGHLLVSRDGTVGFYELGTVHELDRKEQFCSNHWVVQPLYVLGGSPQSYWVIHFYGPYPYYSHLQVGARVVEGEWFYFSERRLRGRVHKNQLQIIPTPVD
jgi:hypothetical protein